jgi:acetyl esterase/lipase
MSPVIVPAHSEVSGFVVNWSTPLDDPSVSPLFGSFKKLPPVCFVVGSHEILLSDSTRAYGMLASVLLLSSPLAKAHNAGVKTKLEVTPYMFHDFALFGDVPEAFNARQSIKRFLEEQGF